MSSAYDLQASVNARRQQPGEIPGRAVCERGGVFRRIRGGDRPGRKIIDPAALDRAASVLLEAYVRGARMFSCGNGGSASIANHCSATT